METWREYPVFETTLVRAKHEDYKLLVLTERLFALMLRPYIIGMLTTWKGMNPTPQPPPRKAGRESWRGFSFLWEKFQSSLWCAMPVTPVGCLALERTRLYIQRTVSYNLFLP